MRGEGQQVVQAHVSEAYSPVRVAGMADKMGLVPGLAMDLAALWETRGTSIVKQREEKANK